MGPWSVSVVESPRGRIRIVAASRIAGFIGLLLVWPTGGTAAELFERLLETTDALVVNLDCLGCVVVLHGSDLLETQHVFLAEKAIDDCPLCRVVFVQHDPVEQILLELLRL